MTNVSSGCLVCNAPLPFHRTLTDRLCGSEACRRKYAAIPKESLCSVCGRPLTALQLAGKVCGDLQCHQVHLGRLRDAQEKKRLASLKAKARRLRSRKSESANEPNPKDYAIAILPSFTNPITPLPADRKAIFREHLQKVIDEVRVSPTGTSLDVFSDDLVATASFEPTESSSEPQIANDREQVAILPIVAGSACATCGGFCCRNGGTHAFVSADTIRRFLAANPDKDCDAAFEEFMGYVPERTYDNSCVYHSSEGCAIPMPYRSKICNDFFCFPLKDLGTMTAEQDNPRVFMVTGNQWEIDNAAFVDVEGRRPVDVA